MGIWTHQDFLEWLFRPNDIIEARIRHPSKRVESFWFNLAEIKALEANFAVWERSDVWVGVLPRSERGSRNGIAEGRTLWVDFNANITSLEAAKTAILKARVPIPSFFVWSGHGIHAYWRLKTPVPTSQLRPALLAVHRALPTDNTHDVQRVMRLPGTYNNKTNEPAECYVLQATPDLLYSVGEFSRETQVTPTTPPRHAVDDMPSRLQHLLRSGDFRLFVENWKKGQRHDLALAISGYCRKNLKLPQGHTMLYIKAIHTQAGFAWPDRDVVGAVVSTYKLPYDVVAGVKLLMERGIVPTLMDSPASGRGGPSMAVIDFSNAPSRQEFWLGSLVGPGLSLLWAAPPKTGKSFAVMQLGYALATGRSIWGFDASTPKRVLYFQGEISDEIVFDRISSCFSNLTPFERGDYAVTSRPDRSFSLIQHPEALYSVAKDADIVIVDPVSLFNPGDENDFASVRNFLDVFGPLKKAGKAVILVHHTRKLGGQRKAGVEDVRGSNAWHAHVDAVVVQSRTDVLGDKDNLHTRVEFSLRGGRDIAPFLLYRLNNGSFTHVFEELLFQSNADQGGLYDEASDGRYTN